MALLWIFRVIFLVIASLVLFFTASSETITKGENVSSFWAVFWTGFGLVAFAFAIDIFTPKKKQLSAPVKTYAPGGTPLKRQ